MLANNTRHIECTRNDEATTNQPDALVTDGGVGWTDLTAFQRDLIVTIAQLKERPKGTEIKNKVRHLRAEEINHGRLYPNLNKLTDRSLLQKGQLDGRTNYYQLTSIAVELLIDQADRLDQSASCAMAEETPIVTDGGFDAARIELSRRKLTQVLNLTCGRPYCAVGRARLQQARSQLQRAGHTELAGALPDGPIDAEARYHIRNVAQQIDAAIEPAVQFDRASNWGEQ